MKKSVLLSLVLSSLMYGFVNPLPNSSKSIENGGTLSAIDAYQDGVGAMVVKSGRGIDNSVMNALVFKYGSEAKDNGVILGDQVILSGTAEDKLLAGKLFSDGTPCTIQNKNNPTYLNGICQGGQWVDGTSCDDQNSATTNDIYTNNICIGSTFTPTSCKSILNAGLSTGNGLYNISSNGNNISVYCDMITDGGGWTAVVNTWAPFYETSHNQSLVSRGRYILSNSVSPFPFKEIRFLAGRTGLILDIKRITTNLSTNITRTDYISQAYIGSNNYSGGLNWTPASAFEFHYFNGAENRLIYRNGANGDDIHAVARYQSTGLNNGNLGSYGLVFIRE